MLSEEKPGMAISTLFLTRAPISEGHFDNPTASLERNA